MIKDFKIILVLIYFIIFASVFSFIVPVFESPDENLHLDFINYVTIYKSLPDQYEGMQNKEKYVGQGHQHPLYYILTSFINYGLNSGDKIDVNPRLNKLHIWNGGTEKYVPVYNNNGESVFNSVNDKYTFYILRLLSVLFGAVNIIFVYKISYLLTSNDKFSALSAFIMGSLPQFAFISGMINNDNMANMMSTICLYLALRIFNDGYSRRIIIILGITLGLALLTKKTLVFLIPGIVILFLYKSVFIYKEFISSFKQLSVILFIAIFISGCILIRNYIVYNEPFGTQMEIDTMPQLVDKKSLFSFYFIYPFTPGLLYSYIGSFGWLTLRLQAFIYLFYILLVLTTIFGFVKSRFIRDKLQPNNFVIMIVFIVICFSGILYFNLTFRQFQGRYMFPAASFISILLAMGLKRFSELYKNYFSRKILTISLIGALFIIDVYCLILVYNYYNNPLNYL